MKSPSGKESNPSVNLLVIRSNNMDQAAVFYEQLGIEFERHRHGQGPIHYAAFLDGLVLEIYPNDSGIVSPIRFGFSVDDVDAALEKLESFGATTMVCASDSQWGRRAVCLDLDGHTIELLAPKK